MRPSVAMAHQTVLAAVARPRPSAAFSCPIQIGILPLHFRTQGSSGYPCDDARSTKFGAPSERENTFFSLTLMARSAPSERESFFLARIGRSSDAMNMTASIIIYYYLLLFIIYYSLMLSRRGSESRARP